MSKQPDEKMIAIRKHMDLRKDYQDTCETRIADNKDAYITHLEATVLAYREKFGGIDITTTRS